MIRVLFFGRLSEQMQTGLVTLDITYRGSVRELLPMLSEKLTADCINILIQNATMLSINQVLADWDSVVKEGDELAFMPPVTGG